MTVVVVWPLDAIQVVFCPYLGQGQARKFKFSGQYFVMKSTHFTCGFLSLL